MATIIVTSNADSGSGSLRKAISDAATGDTITFDDSLEVDGVITIDIESYITISLKDLTIDGEGRVVIDGQNITRAFYIQRSTSNIKGIEFLNCYDISSTGGMSLNTGANVTLENCVFNNCNGRYGGGVSLAQTASGVITNCTFANCIASSGGAAVYCNNSGTTIINGGTFGDTTSSSNILFYNTSGTLTFSGVVSIDKITLNANTSTVINGSLTIGAASIGSGALITFDGIDKVLAITTTFSGSSATYAATTDSTGYLALYSGATAPTVGTGIKNCTYGANILTASIDEDSVDWTATNLSTPILIEQQNNSAWNTLTDSATGGTYSDTFTSGDTVRLFDGVTFRTVTYTPPAPPPPIAQYWLVNSFAVEAGTWTINASAIATNGGGGTDPVTGDPLPYWTITTDDITPNF